jgi:hypothetical protein
VGIDLSLPMRSSSASRTVPVQFGLLLLLLGVALLWIDAWPTTTLGALCVFGAVLLPVLRLPLVGIKSPHAKAIVRSQDEGGGPAAPHDSASIRAAQRRRGARGARRG